MKLQVKNLSVTFEHKRILENLNLTVRSGEFVALIGPRAVISLVLIPVYALLITLVAGLVVLLIRALFVELGWSFRLASFKLFGQEVTFVYKALQYVANTATPFSLIVLGGRFTVSAVKRLWKPVLATTLIRCVAVPAVSLTLAYLLFPSLQGQRFAAYIAVFGTPTAVSSAIMAKEMGADDELAGQVVVWTTLLSAVTIFLEIVVLRAVGIF